MPRLLLLLISGFLPLAARASFTPELNLIEPRGARIGTELDLHFYGKRLEGPQELLFHQPGIEVLSLSAENGDHATARVRIAPDAALGEHPIRLRTSGGISYLRSIWIGQFPTVYEAETEDSFDQPQRVELNTTVQGVAKSEDEDYYAVTLKKGQPLSVEVEAMRLGREFFDAYVAILDPRRFELAACDDVPLLYTDAFASIVAPEDGEYRILVREAAYEGSDSSQYRLHIGSFPRPGAVFPTGARPGETTTFRFIGDPAGEISREIAIPADAAGLHPVFAERDGLRSPSPNWIQVSPLEAVAESEPNNNPKQATPAPPVPCAIHGTLSEKDDRDSFRFSAKKDENLDFRLLGRALRSPVDSVLSLHGPDGNGIADNDDQGGPDSIINWTCPADGEYTIIVRDKLGRGGPTFTYRLEIVRREASLAATLPVFERNNSQARKVICIPRGNRYATTVNLTRSNIGCDVLFAADALPAGVTLGAPMVPRSINAFPVLFEAAADAPIAGAWQSFTVRATGENTPEVAGPLKEEVHQIEINNQGPYHSVFSEKIAVAVIDEAPFHLELETPAVPIVKNGTLQLKVRATRNDGFIEPVTLRFLWNPPGLGSPATINLEKEQNETTYELNANGDAPPGEWQVAVLGEANTPQGPVVVSTSLVTLRVAEPYLTATIDLSATEQGKKVPVLCKVEHLAPFTGSATAELMGLPHGTSTAPIEFSSDQAELTFPVEVAADATVGKHNGLFLRIRVPENGSTILHQTGQGGTLRIDAPAPAPVAANTAEATPAPAAESAEPAKPLSRLEQLRQRANP